MTDQREEMIAVTVYVHRQMHALQAFQNHWLRQQSAPDKDPDYYPEALPAGEWDDQFDMFMEEK